MTTFKSTMDFMGISVPPAAIVISSADFWER